MLGLLVDTLLPVLLVLAAGYGWGWFRQPFDTEASSKLVLDLAIPCLAFNTLAELDVPREQVAEVVYAAFGGMAVFAAAGWVAAKLRGLRPAPYLPSVIFGNNANLGVPLCLFAFGDLGASLALIYTVCWIAGTFTLGVALAGGQFTLKPVLSSVPLYGLLVGLGVYLLGIEPPLWLMNTTDLLGGLAIPLALFAMGYSLSRIPWMMTTTVWVLAGTRLVAGLAIGFGTIWLFDMHQVMAGVILVQAVMPSAVFNYLLAERYEGPEGVVANIVLLSTLISLPAIALALAVGPRL